MKIRNAFTMLELIFVIVIMGIIGKFGVEFLVQAYNSFIASSVNNTLQANSGMAVEFIASRLQNRIKDSVIVRDGAGGAVALSDADYSITYPVLEWVGADMEGFRGNSSDIITLPIFNKPNWSGIIDLDLCSATSIISQETNTTQINSLIDVLSDGGSTVNDAAIYFIGSNSDTLNGYGWNGALLTQNGTMHPIKEDSTNTNENEFISSNDGNFSGVDLYEYYKLAWSAYAIVYTAGTNNKGTLTLHYDYQPWNGDTYLLKTDGNATKTALLMEDVSTFQSTAIGSVIKIQICVKSDLIQEYSLCKEKTVF